MMIPYHIMRSYNPCHHHNAYLCPGKSTLASLLADRLRITTVISTDAVRHMLREHCDATYVDVLTRSTYECDEKQDDGMTHHQRVRQVCVGGCCHGVGGVRAMVRCDVTYANVCHTFLLYLRVIVLNVILSLSNLHLSSPIIHPNIVRLLLKVYIYYLILLLH